jgi:hypothetical protein
MNQLTRYVACSLFLLFSSSLFSQTQSAGNVPLKKPHNDLISVYGQAWVANNPEVVALLEDCKQNRISFREEPLMTGDKYPLLSSFPLMTKNNPNVAGANFSNFTPDSFNPFTYQIEFLSSQTQVIRIDGTNFIMVIAPVAR